MSITVLLQAIGVLAFMLLITYGRASYWKGKFEALDEERPDAGEDDNGGWRSEALFLRRIVNKDAADDAAAEEHY